MNLYKYLKKNKILIIRGNAAGGLPNTKGSSKPLLQNFPCNVKNGFKKRYFNPYILTIHWDSNFDNGILNYQLDEYFNNVWNRTLGVGTAFSDFLHFNETDGIEATLQFQCNKFFYHRNRYNDTNKAPLLMFSNEGKIISEEEKKKALSCDNNEEPIDLDLNANNSFLACNGDSLDLINSVYYDYYCLDKTITSWETPPDGHPQVGSLYVTNDPQLPQCSEENIGYASVIYKISFEDVIKAKNVEQPITGSIIGNYDQKHPVTFNFEITFPTEIPSGKCVPTDSNIQIKNKL